jgi:hypothetical protein
MCVALIAAAFAPSSALADTAGGPSDGGVQPALVPGNAACPANYVEYKVEPITQPGTTNFASSDGAFTATITATDTASGPVFTFQTNLGVDVVLAKGGQNTNSYAYDPEKKTDSGLHAPVNDQNDKFFGLSHISFCVDFELEVAKTATTTFKRDHDWTIAKRNDAPVPVELSPGQTFDVGYTVTVTKATSTDSDWKVSGDISVKNPAPFPAGGVDVTDEVSTGIAAAVDCNGADAGTGLPATIAAGATLTCTYGATLPDGTNRTNTATATSTTPKIMPGSGTAAVTFGAPTVELDKCVDATDDKVDLSVPATLGTVCAADGTKDFTYTKTFGPYPNECTDVTYTNTATFTSQDTGGDTGQATSDVRIVVNCVAEGGCTLTQGYWKTHSLSGPAPYDATWQKVGSLEEKTLFFLTTKTWYEVFWTPPSGGNAFLILAHQYMAATLNTLDGASVPDPVAAALTAAAGLLDNYSGSIPAVRNITRADRDTMLALAGTLAAYNEGSTGPGHCDENA